MKSARAWTSFILTLVLALLLVACGEKTGGSTNSSTSDSAVSSESLQDDETMLDEALRDEEQAAYNDALSGKGLVSTFVGADVTEATVSSDEEAQQVAKSLIERMGGDDTTNLELVDAISTETGNTYYVFQQEAGGIMVHGASVKLIANKDGKVIGLVSAIFPDVKLPTANEAGISQEQAEKTVADELAKRGIANTRTVSEYTAQVIVPLPEYADRYLLAWVVYVDSPAGDKDDQAWLANYVGIDGEYLYSMPIEEPNNAEALGGETPGFDFDAYEQETRTFDVAKNGETVEVSVPVLVDKESDAVAWLGDAERKILCADYSQFAEDGEIVSPIEQDDESFDAQDIAVYENFIRVWDFFDSIGWHGPNGEGTPTLLQMDYREDGEPEDNCVYSGRKDGWETFAFGRVRDYGQATDVMGHEFTHCVTGTTMTTNLYINEPGAINEGMSDILGNLVEMALDGNDGAWISGERVIEGGLRSMSDPTTHGQPEYRWGVFYAPDVLEATVFNDAGGVHVNSSLLNIISYKLSKAGMGTEDQVYFWMNVALAMVPTTDYAQMAELLPWVMEQSGYSQYVDALRQAIDEAGYTKLEQPSEPPSGSGIVEFTYPNAQMADEGEVRLSFYEESRADDGTSEILTWPAARTGLVSLTLPAGSYYVFEMAGEDYSNATLKVYTDKGWVDFGEGDGRLAGKGTPVHVDEGATVELATNGLA